MVRTGGFCFSYDRAHTWQGPFAFSDFKLGDKLSASTDPALHRRQILSGRTDYIVNAPNDCHLFISVKDERVQAGLADRAFAIRTRDGGKTFEFLGWMTGAEPPVVRSAMPATVRANDGAAASSSHQ